MLPATDRLFVRVNRLLPALESLNLKLTAVTVGLSAWIPTLALMARQLSQANLDHNLCETISRLFWKKMDRIINSHVAMMCALARKRRGTEALHANVAVVHPSTVVSVQSGGLEGSQCRRQSK